MSKEIYAGHNSLAEMVSTHLDVWVEVLKEKYVDKISQGDHDNASYYNYELKALTDIRFAVHYDLYSTLLKVKADE